MRKQRRDGSGEADEIQDGRMNSSEPVGTIRAVWRYPVKSMLGEELDAVDLSEGGVVGDRAYALRDRETGKVASAKHPKLWPNLLACRAAFVDVPRTSFHLCGSSSGTATSC
jgi:hypothetical protein